MTNAAQPPRLGLEPACLDMRTVAPRAPAYDDVYFSADGGLAESRHVFIGGNNLRDRLAAWHKKQSFVIGETGFGTGRNVLVACQTFDAVAPADARLHIVSFERHPLTADDLVRIWARHPQLRTYALQFIRLWPEPVRGTHRLQLSDRVTLDLVLDDIEAGLAGFDGRVDAWFLDGFAPARNPAMWRQSVFHKLAAASRSGATFATYSCARMVRDHAYAAGFVWHKRPGYGRKRDMLCGQLDGHETSLAPKRQQRPWYTPPAVAVTGPIAVIGAGIAGASVAAALARRGHGCNVYDPHGGPGGASGNAQAALYIRLAADGDMRSRFYLAALQYTLRWLAELDPQRTIWNDCGLLQLACSKRETERQQRCIDPYGLPAAIAHWVDRTAAIERAGMTLASNVQGGLFFPQAGWIRPAALCRTLLGASGARLHDTAVVSLQQRDRHWRLSCANGDEAEYAHVILACAHGATQLCADLPPLIPVRGQISGFRRLVTLPAPACVVCGPGHVMPPYAGRIHVGASFTPDSNNATPQAEEDEENVHKLAAIAPALASRLGPVSASRVAFRCTGHNRLPYVGPVADTKAWRRDYASLALDARRPVGVPGKYRSGLWASLAHGANGMVSAPLAAEMLASRLLDEPAPVSTALMDALHPGRWLVRELVRGG